MILYVATSNPGKLRDFAHGAGDSVQIAPLPGLSAICAPDENQSTFEGNARIKAVFYSRHAPGELVLADDSGLEVDALGGAPGVRSARYADDQRYAGLPSMSVDERNNACLLHALETVEDRRGRYRCVLAAARDGKVLHEAVGSLEGAILREPRGASGFGYDPLFLVPGEQRTMAELDEHTRLALSHRGEALRKLLAALRTS